MIVQNHPADIAPADSVDHQKISNQLAQNNKKGAFFERQLLSEGTYDTEPSPRDEVITDKQREIPVVVGFTIEKNNEGIAVSTIQEQNHQQIDDNCEEREQVTKTIRFHNNFSQIVELFKMVGKTRKLSVTHSTQNFATLKKISHGPCACLFKIWSKQPQQIVYQLRLINKEKKIAKLILVEGDKKVFHNFYIILSKHLLEKKSAQIGVIDKAEVYYLNHGQKIMQYSQLCESILKKISKEESIKMVEIKNITQLINAQIFRLSLNNSDLAQNEQTTFRAQLERICLMQSKLITVYQKLYQKQYENFREKRKTILKKYTIEELFNQLQIEPHFQQFRRWQELDNTRKDYIPYIEVMKQLSKVTSMIPVVSISIVRSFKQKMTKVYDEYFHKRVKIGDMDEYLPLTIYCVLGSQVDINLLALTKLLLFVVQNEDDKECQRKILTDIQASFDYILNQWKQ